MVVDADSYQVVGDIPEIQGVHGIAIAPEFGKGFITEDEANRVTIFDLRTLKKTATAKTGNSPDGMIHDSSSKRVFVFSGDGKVTAVNAATGAVAGSAELGGSPEFAASDDRGHIYNNLEDKNEVVQIDSRNLRILNRWPLAPGESPSGMAIDAAHHRLFIGCRNRKLVVMDSDTGKVVTTIPISDGVDANRFDPATNLVFSSNGAGTLTVVHEDSRTHTPCSRIFLRSAGPGQWSSTLERTASIWSPPNLALNLCNRTRHHLWYPGRLSCWFTVRCRDQQHYRKSEISSIRLFVIISWSKRDVMTAQGHFRSS